ncbi:hypothetical protein FA95DRAFT_859197 [Auriscalpium vulgare]|uniref:Uncharacterized protein n=1 Tax=Auriscalpium vulgare TaxID=40419 RepID=A0ACB8S0I1_9AGAM|nr:hypothetical protein FA95DRAFT_859197 [Auriscalpium vulgare]
MTVPAAFIIGAGSNVGKAVAQVLKDLGYAVALGSRSGASLGDEFLTIKVDATEPASVSAAFNKVTSELGPPSVVVYNAASFEPIPTAEDALSLPRETFEKHLALGTALFDASQHALTGFRKLGINSAGAPRTFIVTGNIAPWRDAKASYITIQSQKLVEKYLTELFATSYKKEGFQFYFALQVTSAGGAAQEEFNAKAHAVAYKRILEKTSQSDYDVWFVADGSPYEGPKPGPP